MSYTELMRRIAARAHEVPCLTSPAPQAWTAEHDDEQRVAARACHQCPLLDNCRRYALTHAEEGGVWGALTEAQRRQHHRDHAA